MKKFFSGTSLYIMFGILIIVVVVTVLVLIGVGRAYQGGLASLIQTRHETVPAKKKQVKRITFQKSGENTCIEVTPDGVERIYNECGGTLSEARRPDDLRNIQLLFQALSLQDESLYTNTCKSECYIVTIDTDEGTQTLYIPVGGSGTGGSIGNLIEEIKNQSAASPTPVPGNAVVSPSPGVSSSPAPTFYPGISPQPSSTPVTSEEKGTFTCDFSEGGTNKPYRVSGVVCSTEPTPVP